WRRCAGRLWIDRRSVGIELAQRYAAAAFDHLRLLLLQAAPQYTDPALVGELAQAGRGGLANAFVIITLEGERELGHRGGIVVRPPLIDGIATNAGIGARESRGRTRSLGGLCRWRGLAAGRCDDEATGNRTRDDEADHGFCILSRRAVEGQERLTAAFAPT